MKNITPNKKHLLSKRAKIIKFLQGEGYTGEDIGVIFNIDRSGVHRILKAEAKYKGLVRDILKD
jgi:DNA-binding CsgD family transcriptional regulator